MRVTQRVPAFAVCVAISAALNSAAFASASITLTPGATVNYGNGISYGLQGLAGPVQSYKWEYIFSTCPNTWNAVSSSNTTATQNVIEIFPGLFTVRCKIAYSSKQEPGGQPFTPPPESPTVQITVRKPDGIRVFYGNGVSVMPGTGVGMQYQVTCQGQDVPYLSGYAQERVVDYKNVQLVLLR